MLARSCCLLAAFTAVASVRAAELAAPLAVQNQNPFIAVFGLPRYSSARTLAKGQSTIDLSYAVASNFEADVTATEQVVIDGESARWGIRYLRGVGRGWEFGVDVAYVDHSHGYLDGLIIDWHDWFGLPQGGRNEAPENLFHYRLESSRRETSGTNVLLRDRARGMGDVQLLVGKSWRETAASSTALRAHLKLPTGDADELLGSGGYDVGLTVHHARRLSANWTAGVSAGATYLGHADLLDAISRPVIAHLGAFAAYDATDRLRLTMQWDVHSRVYEHTRLRQLNEIAYLLSFGAELAFKPGRLTFAVVENFPHPHVAPDVAFTLGWRWSVAP